MKKILSLLLVVVLMLCVLAACGENPPDDTTGTDTGTQTGTQNSTNPDDVWVDIPKPPVVTDLEDFGTLPGDNNTQYDNVIVD